MLGGSEVAPAPAAAPPVSRRHAWAAWAGAWGAVLALAVWMLRLQAGWLVAALWAAFARVGRRWRLGAAATLLVAVSIGGAVQFRLGRVAGRWVEVRAAAEKRAEEALGEELDGLFDRGFDA